MHHARAMHIAEDITYTYHDGTCGVIETRPGLLAGLDTLVERVAGWMAFGWHLRSMTVLLDASAVKALGLPRRIPGLRNRENHPSLQGLREDGWRVSSLGEWTTVHRDGLAVHLGILPWMSTDGFKFLDPADECRTLYRVGRWHEVTGEPYWGSPGITGNAMLTRNARKPVPFWTPQWRDGHPARSHGTEIGFKKWETARATGEWWHRFDCNKAYLAAAGNAELSVGELRHTGRRDFDKTVSGYWLVNVPAWNLGDSLPHPFGTNVTETGSEVLKWVTTPTLELVAELAEKWGVIDVPRVHDSYTAAKHTRRVLREWATNVRQCVETFAQEPYPADAALMESEGKQIYQVTTNGMWFAASGLIHRPDWCHTIIAKGRSNIFRKLITGGMERGRWPARIANIDTVYYASDSDNPMDAKPDTIVLENRLGGFKYLGSERMVSA